MQFLIIETFRNGHPAPVYRRFRDQGRLAPDGLLNLGSWITADLSRCFHVMECDDPALLGQWIDNWKDLVDFEVMPVLSSAEVQARLAGTAIPSPGNDQRAIA
ncbi:MAG: DUF3303 family protein [Gemmatimonadota bacterium]